MVNIKSNKIIFWFIIIFFTLSVVTAIVFFYINTDAFRSNLKSIIVTQIENTLGKKIEIESLDSISLMSLQLSNFAVIDDDLSEEEILFKAKQVRVKFGFVFSILDWKNWKLDIRDIHLYQASIDITRDLNGEFDILSKFSIDLEDSQQNIFFDQVHLYDSEITLRDKMIYFYNQDALITYIEEIEGHIDISGIPKISFDLNGRQKNENALLALKGTLSLEQMEYSLDFQLENAQIRHFQHYLEVAEEFNINQGEFDLSLNFTFSPDAEPAEINWQGEAELYQVTAKPSFLEGISFNEINGSVLLSKPDVTFSEIKALYHGTPVLLQGYVKTEPVPYFDFDVEIIDINTTFIRDDLSIFTSDLKNFPIQGDITLAGNIKGYQEDFELTAQLLSDEIEIKNTIMQNIISDFSFNNKQAAVHNFTFIDPDSESSVSLEGYIELSDSAEVPFYQILVETEHLSVDSSLVKQLTLPANIAGYITANFKIESNKEDMSVLNIYGNLIGNSLVIEEYALPDSLKIDILSTVRLSESIIFIDDTEITYNENQARLQGIVNYDDIVKLDLSFEGGIPEIDELFQNMEIDAKPAGSAVFEGGISGNPGNPGINAKIQLIDFSMDNYSVDEITGNFYYQNNILEVTGFQIKNKDIAFTGNGDISFVELNSPEIDLSYQLDSLNFDIFSQITDTAIPLTGTTSGNGQITGFWPSPELYGDFYLEQITYDDYILGDGQVVFNLKPEQPVIPENITQNNLSELLSRTGYIYSLQLENFELQNDLMELLISGQTLLGNNNLFSGYITFSHADFTDAIEYFYPVEDIGFKDFIPVNIAGTARLEGDRNEQQLNLSVQFISQEPGESSSSGLDAMITKNDLGFAITDLYYTQPGGEFKAEGLIGIDNELDIDFHADQLDIYTLIKLSGADESINGILDIHGSLKGTIDNPEVFITAQINEGQFREFQFRNLQSDFYWDSKKNEININDFNVLMENDYQIIAKGNIPLKPFAANTEKALPDTVQDFPLDFQILMENADMKILNLFWQNTFSETTGNINMEVNLTGTAGNPLINGVIAINQGILTFHDLPVEVEEINTAIDINDNRVAFTPIAFSLYENNFNISGEFELIDFLPENIIITITNSEDRIVYQDIIESDIDFLAEITGTLLNPEISGNLILSNGSIDIARLQSLAMPGMSIDTFPDSDSNSDFSQSLIDINIEITEPFSLNLPNAEIFITANIALEGTLVDPSVQGNAVLRRGHIVYFERRFDITEGRASINGMTLSEIGINTRAQTTVQDVQIAVNVSGNLDNPQIRLSSQPVMEETEIISLLALGRNIEGLSRGEIDELLSQEMIDILFQNIQLNILRQLEREISSQLGLDLFSLSTENLFTSDNQLFIFENMNLANLRLEIGKSITEDLFVTYETPLNFQGEKSINLNYRFSPDFTLSTQFDTFSLGNSDYRFQFGFEINF